MPGASVALATGCAASTGTTMKVRSASMPGKEPFRAPIRRVLEAEYPGGYPYDRYSPYNGVYQQYMFAYSRSQRKGSA